MNGKIDENTVGIVIPVAGAMTMSMVDAVAEMEGTAINLTTEMEAMAAAIVLVIILRLLLPLLQDNRWPVVG